MELTSTQRLLLNGLDLFKVEKEAMIIILTALQKENQMNELMEYMAKNPEAHQEDILYKTAQIKKRDNK